MGPVMSRSLLLKDRTGKGGEETTRKKKGEKKRGNSFLSTRIMTHRAGSGKRKGNGKKKERGLGIIILIG